MLDGQQIRRTSGRNSLEAMAPGATRPRPPDFKHRNPQVVAPRADGCRLGDTAMLKFLAGAAGALLCAPPALAQTSIASLPPASGAVSGSAAIPCATAGAAGSAKACTPAQIVGAGLSGSGAAIAALAPVQWVAGRTGAVTLAAGDVSGLGALATLSSAPCSALPALSGDVTTSAGGCAATLAASGVAAGGFLGGVVDAKGRVTSVSPVPAGAPLIGASSTGAPQAVSLGAGLSESGGALILAPTSAQVVAALGYAPASRTGDTFTGAVTLSAGLSATTGAFSGALTAPTQAAGDGSAKAATDAFVQTALGTAALKANNLSDLGSASTARTNLGLGSAATQSTGASGAAVPLLSAANTWSAGQTFSGGLGGISGLLKGNGASAPGAAAAGTDYVAPTQAATASVLGLVKPDGTTITNTSGAVSVAYGTAANTAAAGNDSRITGALSAATAASTYAPLASPALSGTPTAPTPAAGDASTRLSTDAFVQAAVAAGAWTAWTPAIAATSGAITTATVVSARYAKVGRTVTYELDFTTPSIGTAAGAITVTMPFAAAAFNYAALGSVIAGSPVSLRALIDNAATLTITSTSGAFLGASGDEYVVSGSYESAS